MVDVDKDEIEFRTVRVDLPICCDAKMFLQEMLRQGHPDQGGITDWWREKCLNYKSYNAIPPEWKKQKEYVNPYVFIDALSDALTGDDIVVVDGGGTVNFTTFQAFKVKEGQRLTISSGICAMGTGLPESIGACFGNAGRRTVCLCGDGSMQLNIQELQTIVHHQLPIKIFVYNNGGYLAIRHTQDGFLNSNYVGSDAQGGLSLPDFKKVAAAYGIKAMQIKSHKELQQKILRVLYAPGPVLCELMISTDQQIMPRQGFEMRSDGTFSPRPLEDMYPYLERQEFLSNMVVAPWGG
jgi:acetolactate synthase-1/2/3 large subunit